MFFKAAQKGQNEWYYYLLTIVVSGFIGYGILGSIPLLVGGMAKGMDLSEMSNVANFTKYFDNLNLLLLLIMLIFVPTAFLFWGCIKLFHKKPFRTVLTGYDKFRWKRFWFAFILPFIFTGGAALVTYYTAPETVTVQFDPAKWGVLVLISFIFIPIQAGWEEAFFRGYLMQGIGVLARNRWVPLLITSLLFGAMHMANPEVVEHGVLTMFPIYFGMGLTFGIMALMDNGLELAMGYHIANNIAISILFTSPESALQTDAILRSNEVADPSESGLMLLGFNIFILLVFALRFKWKNVNQRLFGEVEIVKDQPNLA